LEARFAGTARTSSQALQAGIVERFGESLWCSALGGTGICT